MTGLIARNKTTVILLGAVVLCIIDRILKQVALTTSKMVSLIDGWLNFELHTNKGIAFSLGSEQNLFWFVIIVALIIAYFTIRLVQQKKYFEASALFAVLLGALSNIYDRIAYGSVIDYFSFLSRNVFNLADVSILIGALIFIIESRRKRPLDI
jgi:signal peptidase II